MRLYVSHSIRGRAGRSATAEQMNLNCQKAIKLGKQLREEFPKHEFYIPADHDLFVQKAYLKGYLTEEQILDIDCDIIKGCDALIIYTPDGYISYGMNVEIDYTTEHNIPIFVINRFDAVAICDLGEFLDGG